MRFIAAKERKKTQSGSFAGFFVKLYEDAFAFQGTSGVEFMKGASSQ
jgi:hypothetical protein